MDSDPRELDVFSVSAERPKFTSSLLLLAGLWCRATVWRPAMGYLAHRGWECGAFVTDSHGAGFEYSDRFAAVLRQIQAQPAPPVVVGHDIGAAIALSAAGSCRAVVALAPPFAPEFSRRVQSLRPWTERLWPKRAPLAAAPPHLYPDSPPPGGLVVEPNESLLELDRWTPSCPLPCPALVLVGERDPLCDVKAIREWGERCGADVVVVPGAGHGLPWAPGWEALVTDVHRWLVRTLGESLLAMLDESEED